MTRGRSSHPATKLMSPEVGKWVTVNVNGNVHHEARILISPYTVRQFENLLSHLTDKLKPPFGAVWRLFTETGTEIKDLEDIKGGGTYIASGRAKPMFPVRARSGRSRRDEQPQQEREMRSHSAVGSLGGSLAGGPAGAAGHTGYAGPPSAACKSASRAPAPLRGSLRRAPDRVLDTSSDTNVPGPAAAPSRPSRPAPAPRRAKGRSTRAGDQQLWDQPLHTQQQCQYHQAHQQPPSSTKRIQSASKTQPEQDFSSDEEMERAEGISLQPNLRS